MYLVIVYVKRDERIEFFEFLEDTRDTACQRAEEVAQAGCWTGVPEEDQFIAPASILSIEVMLAGEGREEAGDAQEP